MNWRTYFRHPVPSRRGFAPYRSPGPVVHVPVAFFLLAAVWIFGSAHPLFLLLIALQLVPALYLGRDVAIASHYFPPLTWAVYALALVTLTILRPTIANWQTHHVESPTLIAALLPVIIAWSLLLLRFAFVRPLREEP